MEIRKCLLLSILTSTTLLGATHQSDVLPPVIVNKTEIPHPSFSAGPKTLVTREQMILAGVTSLSQALQNLGLVQLHETVGNGSGVSLVMRGFGENASSNSLFLINGIPITNPDLASPDLNVIPLNEIESIEIIAGSESVLYGDQAVGGAVNIITRENINERFELSCAAGSYQQRNCSIGLHGSWRDWRSDLAVTSLYADNYRSNNDFWQNRLFGRVAYNMPNGRAALVYALTKEYMQYPGALTLQQVRENRRQAKNHTDYFKDLNGYLYYRQQYAFNDNWHLEVDLMHRAMQGTGVLTSSFDQSRRSNFIKPIVKGHICDTTVLAGVDLQDDRYDLESVFGKTIDRQSKYSAFALAFIPYREKFRFSLGGRIAEQNSHLRSYVDNDNTNQASASNIGLLYLYQPDLEFFLRRAGSFRFPKADENASTPPGTKGLKTQRGVSYEGGMQLTKPTYSLQAQLYQLNLIDEIAFDPLQTPQNPFGTNRNYPPTYRRGMSVSGKYGITPKLFADGQINYVDARFRSGLTSGKRIPLVSEVIMRAGLNYQINEFWNAYVESIFTGNQFAANDVANISSPLGGYTVYNFNVRYTWRELSLSLHMNNIFDKKYYFYSVYQGPNTFYYPAPERNILLILNYSC